MEDYGDTSKKQKGECEDELANEGEHMNKETGMEKLAKKSEQRSEEALETSRKEHIMKNIIGDPPPTTTPQNNNNNK